MHLQIQKELHLWAVMINRNIQCIVQAINASPTNKPDYSYRWKGYPTICAADWLEKRLENDRFNVTKINTKLIAGKNINRSQIKRREGKYLEGIGSRLRKEDLVLLRTNSSHCFKSTNMNITCCCWSTKPKVFFRINYEFQIGISQSERTEMQRESQRWL